MENRITESQLVLPSLYLMSLNNGKITMSELIKLLMRLIKPTGDDAKILTNRSDTYFSQKVRNLKSHDTFQRKGFATYEDGVFYLTPEGYEYVKSHEEDMKYLFYSDFDYNDVLSNLENISKMKRRGVMLYREYVSEGESSFVMTKAVKRSQKLRKAALDYFTHDGIIKCDCCGFEFSGFYGNTYGTPCIEIHHLKPIFQYGGVSMSQAIDEALKNLLPVCPNCHRVIHKNHITASMIPKFKEELLLRNSTFPK